MPKTMIEIILKVRFENNNFVLVIGGFGVDLTRTSINIPSAIQTIYNVKTLNNSNFVKSRSLSFHSYCT